MSRAVNALTALADRFGSDKGSRKHRYTELYHMLFSPFRDRAVTLLEMGLMIGGPEHGASADREVAEPPSVAMWLEYFPKGCVIGLDVSDFSAHQTERFRFIRCDMDSRANIDRAAAEIAALGAPDIVIDDASHASAHQQDAFLALFPVLKSGGLYVIEDLRWQPPAYEARRKGFTKTAALFQSFLTTGEFAHADPAYATAMNALRPSISGCFVFQARWQKARRDQVAVIHKL
ncbi:MAG: hypothetical protein ACE37J_00090 [Pikeienuella sp.]|uniref:hypothetical protein n=1 Tax=Pikeienuella sp. TaxID=2831957 RepID=UPI0039193C03